VTNPELEQAIVANPDDTSARSVYADWLQSQGDPRGELIALQLAGKESDAEALIAKHTAALLGPLAQHRLTYDGEKRSAFDWKYGFIHRAHLSHNSYAEKIEGATLADVLRLLLAHPSGRFLAELHLTFNNDPNEDNLQSLIDVLAEAPRPTIRKLHFGDFKYAGAARSQDQGEDTEISWYSVGNLASLWAQVPNLATLIIQTGAAESAMAGGTQLGALALPKLRHFEWRTGGLESANADAIVAARLPSLEHLDMWTGHEGYGCGATREHVMALLAGDFPKLRHLGIMNCEFTDAIVEDLAKSPLLAQLTELDLSLGCLTDEGAAVIAKHKDAFAHLEQLDASYTYISPGALDGCAKQVVTLELRTTEGDDRYPAVGE